MTEFQIGSFTYRARRMAALDQFAVLSKLSPLAAAGLGDLIPALQRLKAEGIGALGGDATSVAIGALKPVAAAFASMPDAHRNEVLHACLDLVERKGPMDQGWAKIWSTAARQAMFEDINADLPLMLQITYEVLKANFVPFFNGLLPE